MGLVGWGSIDRWVSANRRWLGMSGVGVSLNWVREWSGVGGMWIRDLQETKRARERERERVRERERADGER